MNRTYRDMLPRWAIRYVDSLLEDRMVLTSNGDTIPLSDTEETRINAWTLRFDVQCYAGMKRAGDGVMARDQDKLAAWLKPFGITFDRGAGAIDFITKGYDHAVFVIPPLKELEQTYGCWMVPDLADKAEEGEPDPLIG
jgi:hypothetical protein